MQRGGLGAILPELGEEHTTTRVAAYAWILRAPICPNEPHGRRTCATSSCLSIIRQFEAQDAVAAIQDYFHDIRPRPRRFGDESPNTSTATISEHVIDASARTGSPGTSFLSCDWQVQLGPRYIDWEIADGCGN